MESSTPSPSASGGVLVPLPQPARVANKSVMSNFENIELEIMFHPLKCPLLKSLNALGVQTCLPSLVTNEARATNKVKFEL